MHNEKEIISEFKLADTESGRIEVALIKEPYGKNSKTVASIGVFLKASNEEPDWKTHIPIDNIDDIIVALQRAKEQM